jgi:hypothetical protein
LEEEDMIRMMDERRKEREREVWELEKKYAVQRAQRERCSSILRRRLAVLL